MLKRLWNHAAVRGASVVLLGTAVILAGHATALDDNAQETRAVRPCAQEDLSGSQFPCRWDAATRGSHPGGDAFTAYTFGLPVGGMQTVIISYDNGEIVLAQADTR